jgi:hypothetical protein
MITDVTCSVTVLIIWAMQRSANFGTCVPVKHVDNTSNTGIRQMMLMLRTYTEAFEYWDIFKYKARTNDKFESDRIEISETKYSNNRIKILLYK